MDRRTFVARSLALAGPLLAGCSQDGGTASPTRGPTGTTTRSSATSPTSSPTASPTASPTPGPSSAREAYPDYNWDALEGVDPTPTTTVTLRNTAFRPPVAAVHPGTAVTFANNDSFGHTVTVPALDVSRELAGGGSTTVTFEDAGTYDYVCEFHPPSMLGRVVVSETTPTATPTASPTPEPSPPPTPSDDATPTESPTPTEDDGGYY